MASEMLNQVLAAEKAAQDAQASAREEADLIIARARAQAEEIISKGKAAAQVKSDEELALLNKRIAEIENKAQKDADKERDSIIASATSKREEAVKAVVENILHG